MIAAALLLMSLPLSEPVGIRGSFVIAAICKDGIILASDSRANIFDKTDTSQRPIAYYDTIQKVFPIGTNALAETGQGLILGTFFSAIVQDFAKRYAAPVSVETLLPSFISYCERAYPDRAVSEIRRQKLFAAGYKLGVPTICCFNEDQPGGRFGCVERAGYVESAPTLLSDYKPAHLLTMSAAETATLAEKAIRAYARHDDRWKTIGGPVSILLVTSFGTRWIKNQPPQQEWKGVRDLIKDYQGGRLPLHLIPPTTKKQLESLFATVTEGQ